MTLRRRARPAGTRLRFETGRSARSRAAPLVLAAPAAATSQRPRSRPSPGPDAPMLTEQQAVARFLREPKVADWLDALSADDRSTDASFDRATRPLERARLVGRGRRDRDRRGRRRARGRVVEAWTGPQVAWKMARGGDGAFGGKVLDRPCPSGSASASSSWSGSPTCGARSPFATSTSSSLLSFSVSLCVLQPRRDLPQRPARLPAARLPARPHGLDRLSRPRAASWRPLWPVWVLAAAAVFLAGFRVGLNVQAPRGVIDVGYAGVIGADRILDGQAPYGHMPIRGDAAARAARPTPTATSATGSRRTAAASRRTSAATRTARPPTSPTSRRPPSSAGAAAGTRCRPRTPRRSPSTC